MTLRWFACMFFVVAPMAACATPPQLPTRPLTPYGGREAALFDDSIDLDAFGAAFGTGQGGSDVMLFTERTEASDAVLRVRVTTVTVQRSPSSTCLLSFRVVGRLAGIRPPPDEFSVTIGERSPAIRMIRELEGRLVGHSFIAFVRRFGSPAEAPLHLHLSADSPEVAKAVTEASTLSPLHR